MLRKFLICLLCVATVVCAAGCKRKTEVKSVEINDNREIIITYPDNRTQNLGKVPDCEHTYTDWEVACEADCTCIGVDVRYCTKCGEYDYEFHDSLGHDWDEGTVLIQPTCTEKGTAVFKCKTCGLTMAQDIEEIGHTFVSFSDAKVTHGYQYCKYCGETKSEEVHTFEDGKCSVCGLDYDEYLDMFNGTYGYEYFGSMENGEGFQGLYSEMDRAIRQFHNSGNAEEDNRFATIDYTVYGLTKEQAISVWKTYHDDNPLYYWLSNKVGYNTKVIVLFAESEFAAETDRTEQNNAIYLAAEKLLQTGKSEQSAYMIALAYHDAIIKAIDYYVSEGSASEYIEFAHDIRGVLGGLGAVCEGYARTFQLLLNVSGVENVFVTGGNHAWNLVQLDDGEWYWYDLTWDDAPNSQYGVKHTNLCAIDEGFTESHIADSSSAEGKLFLYELPVRSQTVYAGEELKIDEKFTVGGVEYTVAGYNTASTTDNSAPETVDFGGRTYSVITV